MPETRVTMPGGDIITFPEGMSDDAINSALRQISNPPPPGVMIHEPGRSYITGASGAPSVDTTGMAPGVGMAPAAGGIAPGIREFTEAYRALGGGGSAATPDLKPGLPSREEAAAALAMRQRGGSGAILPRSLLPFAQGATQFNVADELASASAGVGSMVKGGAFDKAYNLAQEAQRQDLAQARQESPTLSTASQIGGSLVTAPLAMYGGLGRLAAGGASLGSRIAGGAGVGAGFGAAAGFGEGSGLEDRLAKTIPGAAVGLAVGGGIPAAGSAVQNLARRGLDYLNINRNLRNTLGVDRPAADAVLRSLDADAAFQGPGRANLLAAGPEGMLADVGGATQSLLDTTVRKGGAGSLPVRQSLEQRGEAAHRQLTDVLDTALGPPRGLQTMQQEVSRAGRAGRRTAYNAAYSSPIDYSTQAGRELEGLINNRVPADAIAAANAKMRIRGEPPSAQIRITIDQNGNAVFDRLPDVRQVDYITRGLRERAESPDVVGALGGRTDKASDLLNLAGDIRDVARGLVPNYGRALDIAGDDIGRVQALRLGKEILSPSMTQDDVVQGLTRHRASADEMARIRSGFRSAINDEMAKVRAIASNPNQDIQETTRILGNLNSRLTQDKIDAIVTDPLIRQQMREQLDQATRAIQLRANMATNSKTFGLTVQEEAKRALLEPGPLGAAARGKPINALQRTVQSLTGRTPQYDVGREDLMNRQIAELLTVARGPAAQQQLDTLRQAYIAAPQNAATAQQTGRLAAPAGLPVFQALRELLGY